MIKLPITSFPELQPLNHPNNFHRRMFKLNAKFDADSLLYLLCHFECNSYTLHMLTQQHLLPTLPSTVSAHSCIMSRAVFDKISNHSGDLAPLQPRCGTLRLLAFPQTKITFKREEILDRQWDSGKYNGAADGDWENCVRSQGAYFEGDWGAIVLSTMFLFFFWVALYFLNYFMYNVFYILYFLQ